MRIIKKPDSAALQPMDTTSLETASEPIPQVLTPSESPLQVSAENAYILFERLKALFSQWAKDEQLASVTLTPQEPEALDEIAKTMIPNATLELSAHVKEGSPEGVIQFNLAHDEDVTVFSAEKTLFTVISDILKAALFQAIMYENAEAFDEYYDNVVDPNLTWDERIYKIKNYKKEVSTTYCPLIGKGFAQAASSVVLEYALEDLCRLDHHFTPSAAEWFIGQLEKIMALCPESHHADFVMQLFEAQANYTELVEPLVSKIQEHLKGEFPQDLAQSLSARIHTMQSNWKKLEERLAPFTQTIESAMLEMLNALKGNPKP